MAEKQGCGLPGVGFVICGWSDMQEVREKKEEEYLPNRCLRGLYVLYMGRQQWFKLKKFFGGEEI